MGRMSAVIWVSAIASLLGVLVWLAALVWAARQDGRVARRYAERHPAHDGDERRPE